MNRARFFKLQIKDDTRNINRVDEVLADNRITSNLEYSGDTFNELEKGDIILVHKGNAAEALVEILYKITDNREIKGTSFGVDYKVKVLSYFKDSNSFPYHAIGENKIGFSNTFSPLTNTKTKTYNFILNWYSTIVKTNIMENIKVSETRQEEIKVLWNNYKSEVSDADKNYIKLEVKKLLDEWELYRDKIESNTLELEDYTNRINNPDATLPGGYLCNFLERTTRHIFGSSKPGTANNFGVKLNENNTYAIGNDNLEASKEIANDFYLNNIKDLIRSIVESKDVIVKVNTLENSNYKAKQILRKLAVLDNLYDFIYIYSDPVIDALHNELLDSETSTNLGKNYEIRKALNHILDIENTPVDNILLSRFIWKYGNTQGIADVNTPNVILYGPPGTGKTYAVKNSLDFLCQGDRSRYEFVQFHPSFTYEDFIEGIKPKGVTENGNIKFELVDGIFKRFCKRAKENPNKDYYFVVDEINRANLSSVFGETLLCIEKDYRHDGISDDNLIKTQYSSLIEDMIKESEENKGLAYHLVDGNAYFGVPKNVFFIGMMNDVDKSIDAFDLALRRRFKWIRKDCDYEVIENEVKFRNGDDFHNIEKYSKSCKNLNDFISEELGMGKSYEFGHSFFMKISGIANSRTISYKNLNVLFNLHLRPTLKEYLRSMFAESQLDNKLEEALSVFVNPISK
ncbi:AAA family ATPase [Kordia algicida OT-1]|uniref:Component of 5-methylcytosine-specific restriction enzyme McrBC n=1 Tax=Kordia algicida OT-1 TaxID=391587 RepID=A9DR66_9FLAO|nr:AAA family ATPase [Kordia algicida]EDP96748.1 component of 5-methylcytosine-specific restriction enzyme McrBC [Kordia algicida OT-1]